MVRDENGDESPYSIRRERVGEPECRNRRLTAPARPDLPSPICDLPSPIFTGGLAPFRFHLGRESSFDSPSRERPGGIDSESRWTKMGGEGRSLGRARPSITSTSTAIAEHEYEYEVRARARNRNRRSATEAVLGSMFAAGRELGPALRASVFRSRNPGLRLARSSHRLHPGLD